MIFNPIKRKKNEKDVGKDHKKDLKLSNILKILIFNSVK